MYPAWQSWSSLETQPSKVMSRGTRTICSMVILTLAGGKRLEQRCRKGLVEISTIGRRKKLRCGGAKSREDSPFRGDFMSRLSESLLISSPHYCSAVTNFLSDLIQSAITVSSI